MNRFWQPWLAVIAAAAMISPAVAFQQQGSGNIGSYQSILSRAGFSPTQSGSGSRGEISGQVVPSPPSASVNMPGQIYDSGMQGMPGHDMTNYAAQGYVDSAPQGYAAPAVQGYGAAPVMAGQPCDSGCGSPAYSSAPVYGGEVINTAGSSMVADGGYVGGVVDAGFDGGCAAPVYQDVTGGGFSGGLGAGAGLGGFGGGFGSKIGNAGPLGWLKRTRQSEARNYVFGFGVLFFERDYEDGRLFARDASGTRLQSDDADFGNMTGFETSITKRGSRGVGWQALWWGFNNEQASSSLTTGPYFTNLRGLDRVFLPGSDVYSIYNAGSDQSISRGSDINNVEFNFLRNAGRFGTLKNTSNGCYELFGGFRWFQFDEQFLYQTSAPRPTSLRSDVENTLLGLQVGGRRDYCVKQRFSLGLASKFGVFNNRASKNVAIQEGSGLFARGLDGRDYNFAAEKDDLSFLGELDASAIFSVRNNMRLRVGYRVVAATGVALSTNQIPNNFNDYERLDRVFTNGDLVLGGGYVGFDYAY